MRVIPDGTEFTVEEPEAWGSLIVGRGSIVEALISGTSITEEEDLWAGFLVIDTKLHNFDASVLLEVKSLGCTHADTTKELSSMFNRRKGCLHLCNDAACLEDLDNALHITRLRVYSREGFHKGYMTHYVRNQIKVWLTNAGLLDADQEGEPEAPESSSTAAPGDGEKRPKDSALGDRAKRPSSGALGDRAKRRKDPQSKRPRSPSAGHVPRRSGTEEMEAKRADLRHRLEAARLKMAGHPPEDGLPGGHRPAGEDTTPSRGLERASYVESSGEECSPSLAPDVEALESGTLLPALAALSTDKRHQPEDSGGEQKKKKKKKVKMRGSSAEGEQSKKKKKPRAGVESRALAAINDGTTGSLQTQLLRRAAEMAHQQAEQKHAAGHKTSAKAASRELLRILTQAGKDRKKDGNGKKKKKKRRSQVKRENPEDPSDSSSSSSSRSHRGRRTRSSSNSSSSGSEEAKLEAPLRRRSKKRPGSVLEMLVEHARAQLD